MKSFIGKGMNVPATIADGAERSHIVPNDAAASESEDANM
jgi:hypothetical protein